MSHNVTMVLHRAAAGDRQAAADLLPLVYTQLRAAAQLAMKNERTGHTLSATALVHEAYVRLVGVDAPAKFEGRAHFYAAAAEAMRRQLIDHARARLAQKRGGPGEDHARSNAPFADTASSNDSNSNQAAAHHPKRLPSETLREVADLAMCEDPERVLILDEAISRLEIEDPHAAAVVRLRFFAGLSIEQTCEILGRSKASVHRDWQFARAWLFQALGET